MKNGKIDRVGIIGYGFVGKGMGHALGLIAEVAWHDPAEAGSRPLPELANWAHVLFICVPTPPTPSGAAELSTVRKVVAQLANLGVDVPVVLKSTVPPGTTDDFARRWPTVPLVFSPEFLREQYHIEDADSPGRIVLGWSSTLDKSHRAQLRELFSRRFPELPIVELRCGEAELLKYATNAIFGVKVSFANEMADLAERLGACWESVRAALVLDPRVGDGHLAVPGPDGQRGFGGKCLPKDIAALLAVAEDVGVNLDVVTAAHQANLRRREPGSG